MTASISITNLNGKNGFVLNGIAAENRTVVPLAMLEMSMETGLMTSLLAHLSALRDSPSSLFWGRQLFRQERKPRNLSNFAQRTSFNH